VKNDDEKYIRRCLDGDREAFREIVLRYQSSVLNTIYRMVHNTDTAQDLSQEVFIKAYTKLSMFDLKYPFRVWILRIATYHTIDYLRRRKPEFLVSQDSRNENRPTVIDLAYSREPAADVVLWRKEQSGIIADAIRCLDAKLKAVVVLRHYEDLNYDEIAEILKIPMGTVKNRLYRAREKLQKLILQNQVTVQEVVS